MLPNRVLVQSDRHSRESGNPASLKTKTLGPRVRGDDGLISLRVVMFKNRLSLEMQLDVVQDRIVLARDFVFDQRSAARAEELPEHRAIVDVTPVIADVRVGGTDIGIAAHALLLVIAARESQVRGAPAARGVHAVLFSAQLEAVRQARKQDTAKADDVAIFLP